MIANIDKLVKGFLDKNQKSGAENQRADLGFEELGNFTIQSCPSGYSLGYGKTSVKINLGFAENNINFLGKIFGAQPSYYSLGYIEINLPNCYKQDALKYKPLLLDSKTEQKDSDLAADNTGLETASYQPITPYYESYIYDFTRCYDDKNFIFNPKALENSIIEAASYQPITPYDESYIYDFTRCYIFEDAKIIHNIDNINPTSNIPGGDMKTEQTKHTIGIIFFVSVILAAKLRDYISQSFKSDTNSKDINLDNIDQATLNPNKGNNMLNPDYEETNTPAPAVETNTPAPEVEMKPRAFGPDIEQDDATFLHESIVLDNSSGSTIPYSQKKPSKKEAEEFKALISNVIKSLNGRGFTDYVYSDEPPNQIISDFKMTDFAYSWDRTAHLEFNVLNHALHHILRFSLSYKVTRKYLLLEYVQNYSLFLQMLLSKDKLEIPLEHPDVMSKSLELIKEIIKHDRLKSTEPIMRELYEKCAYNVEDQSFPDEDSLSFSSSITSTNISTWDDNSHSGFPMDTIGDASNNSAF
ncbi:MAG: hypothetical protein SFT68_01065 [Rickettsiaceae bacterium]|nr:hypothetical protein [Rickettsiaceae bacterium]